MIKLKRIFNKLSKPNKTNILIIVVVFTLLLSIGIPSLARYKNRGALQEITVWDGSIASNYQKGSGLQNDPYVISDGSELAYFYNQLLTQNYDNTYFILSNDIILNDGIFNYDNVNGMQYIKNNTTYYIKQDTNEYYDNISRDGSPANNLNEFNSLKNFKGTFDGKSFTIYGLYMSDSSENELALFTNLEGNIKDLYIKNTLVSGGNITSGLASKATNSMIKDVLFDGYVIGNSSSISTEKNISLTNEIFEVNNFTISDSINLYSDSITSNELTTSSLTGTVTINNSDLTNTSILINGVQLTSSEFQISLGNNILNNISINITTTDENVEVTLSNLNYNVTYQTATAGGIVGEAINTTIKNSVNKGYIYGNKNSGGIAGVLVNTNLSNSYNTGNIVSVNNSAGLVGKIVNSSIATTISNCYNIGNIDGLNSAGLISSINSNTNISISNSFNTSQTNYNIRTIDNTVVTITNSYLVSGSSVETGNVVGSFNTITLNDLYNKTIMTSSLSYNEFIDKNDLSINENNVWIYEYESLPILYIDDPIANIHAGIYTWNNLKYNLTERIFNSNITFNIEAADIELLKNVYYYISNSSNPLTKRDLEAITSWQTYTNIEEINTEGFYVIYAKVVDYDNNITYLNSDLLILDLSGSVINIKLNNNSWDQFETNLDYIYINSKSNLEIEANDAISGVASTKYYISSAELTDADLDDLELDSWLDYTTPILIDNNTKRVVYVRVEDNSGFITYANTDYIILNGYNQGNLTLGRNTNNNLNNLYITNKSTISFNFTYEDEIGYAKGYTHNLVSTILLPINTKITLIDNNTGKVYMYKITSSDDLYGYNDSCELNDINCVKKATYPLSLFKTGKMSTNEYFNENDYYNTSNIDEDFKVIVDLSETTIESNYNNISVYMDIKDSNNKISRTTLKDTIKTFNIYSSINEENTDAELYLSADYNNTTILYNTDSSTNINIRTGFNYKYIDDIKIFDTTHENMNIGLLIKLINSDGSIVGKKYLKNIIIKIDDVEYAAENDGVFRINLNSGITDISKELVVITNEDNMKLPVGNYTLNISNYVSYDGLYTTDISNNNVDVPIYVSNSSSGIKYNFDVIINDSNRIIKKSTGLYNVNFSIIQNGSLREPNIRVSLYKKDTLTAYNQDYSIVDIKNYITNSLTVYEGNVYYAFKNPIKYRGTSATYNNLELTLITSNFENTGYKFVYELYDGDKKIGAIEKNFIVK